MEPKFRVSLDIQEAFNEFTDFYQYLDNVTPESLSIQCPHCGVYSTMRLDANIKRSKWEFDLICTCVHCEETVFAKAAYIASATQDDNIAPADSTTVISIHPQIHNVDIPEEIPKKYRTDYREAFLVLDLSPKASAALSRRILQNIIREEFSIHHTSLDKALDAFLKLKDVPSFLAESVDMIRVIGNFAAHPIKDINTGDIVDVEPGEADWLLEVLEQLFDFAFVQPQKLKEKRDRLDAKLQLAGKPALKKPNKT